MKQAQVLNDKDIKRVLAAIAKRSYSSRDRAMFMLSYTDDGQKHLIEVDKRLRQWWTKQQDGKVLFTVRYGSKPLEFEKGKGAIVLKSMDELLEVLPKLIAAAEAGEFDKYVPNIISMRKKRADT